MPEREASIVVKYVGDAADAKAVYDDLRNYATANPIGIRMAVPGQRASEVATFSGGGPNAPVGVGNVPDARPREASPGEVGVYQAVSALHGMGGTGISPATGPAPTAYTNSVYGDASKTLGVGSFAAALAQGPSAETLAAVLSSQGRYGGFRLPQLPGGSADGDATLEEWRNYVYGGGEAFQPSIGAAAVGGGGTLVRRAMADAGASATFYRASNPYSGPNPSSERGLVLRGSGSGLERSTVVEGELIGEAPAARAFTETVDGSIARGRSGNPFGLSDRRLFAVGAAIGVAVDTVDRVGTYIQEGSDRNRYDSTSDAAQAAYTDARGTGFLARQFSRLGNTVGGWFGYSNVFQDVDAARDVSRQQQGTDITNQAIAQARQEQYAISLIGRSGYGAEYTAATDTFNETGLSLNARAIANPFANLQPLVTANQDRLNRTTADIAARVAQDSSQQSAQAAIATLVGANDPRAAGVAQIDAQTAGIQFQLARDTAGLPQSLASQLITSTLNGQAARRDAFLQGYDRTQNANSLASEFSSLGSSTARRGSPLAGQLLEIEGDTNRQLQLAPAYEQYLRDASKVSDADRRNIEDIIQNGQDRRDSARAAYQADLTVQAGGVRATELRSAFLPYDADRAEVRATYMARTLNETINMGSTQALNAVSDRDAGNRAIDVAQGTAALNTGIGLATDRAVSRQLMNYRPIAAEVEGSVGGTIGDAVGLYERDRSNLGLVRERLENGVLALRGRESMYAASFRGESRDPFLQSFASRDFDNISESFGAYDAGVARLRRLEASIDAGGANFLKDAGKESGADALASIPGKIDQLITAIQAIAPAQ